MTIAIMISLAGCESIANLDDYWGRSKADGLNGKIRDVAYKLTDSLRAFERTEKNIAIATFVDLDDLTNTSAFGRYVSEQLLSELHIIGFNVRELRQRVNYILVPKKGELALTRNSAEALRNFQVDVIVVGSYSIVGHEVVVNTRMISVDSSRVVSVGRMIVKLAYRQHVRDLLKRRSKQGRPLIQVYGVEEG